MATTRKRDKAGKFVKDEKETAKKTTKKSTKKVEEVEEVTQPVEKKVASKAKQPKIVKNIIKKGNIQQSKNITKPADLTDFLF